MLTFLIDLSKWLLVCWWVWLSSFGMCLIPWFLSNNLPGVTWFLSSMCPAFTSTYYHCFLYSCPDWFMFVILLWWGLFNSPQLCNCLLVARNYLPWSGQKKYISSVSRSSPSCVTSAPPPLTLCVILVCPVSWFYLVNRPCIKKGVFSAEDTLGAVR